MEDTPLPHSDEREPHVSTPPLPLPLTDPLSNHKGASNRVTQKPSWMKDYHLVTLCKKARNKQIGYF